MEKPSYKEDRIRKITHLYYSRPDIQKAMLEFSRGREISPRFYEGFGKRPDILHYPNDIFQLVKKGATSFHCSEEHWEDPLKLETGMPEREANELREGWDLLLDIDCKWIEYSKYAAEAILLVLKRHGVTSVGVKFSGSKGFHIIVPWGTFPKEVSGITTSDAFPELPRKVVAYIRSQAEKTLRELLPENFLEEFKEEELTTGIRCNECGEMATPWRFEQWFCPQCEMTEERRLKEGEERPTKCAACRTELRREEATTFFRCITCETDSLENPDQFSRHREGDLFELMGLDVILVSPRHLFRMPYSLHEKTALASVPFPPEKIREFDLSWARPLSVTPQTDFYPIPQEDEAKRLVTDALEWYRETTGDEEELNRKKVEFTVKKIEGLNDSMFPPSITTMLKGVKDGRKRALFVLLGFFRALGMEKEQLEKRLFEWNEKNEVPLKRGYVVSQLIWSYRNKVVLPPNFSKDYYKGIGIVPTQEELTIKNPVTYVLRKHANMTEQSPSQQGKNTFKKKKALPKK